MTKNLQTRADRRDAAVSAPSKRPFVLGRRAFAKVSAVEGITVSTTLEADLRDLEKSPSAKRRQVLAAKYAKT